MATSTNLYPQGNTAFYRKFVTGILKFIRRSDATEIFSIDGALAQINVPNLTRNKRHTVTLAEVKAGHTLLPAVPGYKYRLVDLTMISLGGASADADSVDVTGTQSGSPVILVSNAITGDLGTQSLLVPMGESTGSSILADGASFALCDANTAITIADAGASALSGCTDGIDVDVTYVLEKA
jgi:hypothetical protein